MKQLFKLVSASTALVSALAITPTIHSTVDAAGASISTLAYNYGGQQFTVSYDEYTDAIFDESGDLYDFIMNEQPKIQAVGLANGTHVKYDVFATAVLDDSEGKNPLSILEDLSEDSSNTVADSEVLAYPTLNGFDDSGEPNYGDAVTPEVISID